jgi:hypothetical protein
MRIGLARGPVRELDRDADGNVRATVVWLGAGVSFGA